MATSVVEICNNALQHLGANPIMALDDGSKEASYANQFYAQTRDAILRAHPWNFAIRRQALAKAATAPIFGFANAFTLPADPYCLRVLETDPPEAYYKIEGRSLLTDEGAISIRYIASEEDPSRFDPLFTEALAAALAAKLAFPVVESATLQKLMIELAIAKLAEARSIDSQEGSTDPASIDVLVNVRHTSGFWAWDRNLPGSTF